MALINASFELPAEQPGLALSWTLTPLSAAYEKAGFGAASFVSPAPVDWTDVTGVGLLGTFVPAVIAPNGYFSFGLVVIAALAHSGYSIANDHNLVYIDNDNRLYYNSNTSKLVLRTGGVTILSAALTWAPSTTLTLTVKHAATGRELTVAGAATGNGTVNDGAGSAPPLTGLLRRGYVLGFPGQVEGSFAVSSWIAVGDTVDVDDFEHRWRNYYFDTAPYAPEMGAATFTTGTLIAESFEEDWIAFLRALSATAEAPFDGPPAAGPITNSDSFEQLAPWMLDLVSTEAAGFGIETFDPLGWDASYTFAMGSVTAAAFAGANVDSAETFERLFVPNQIAVLPAPTSEIEWGTGQPFVPDDRVGFTTLGTFPLGISDGILYYVVNPTTLTLQISQALGGSPQVISDYGNGQLRIHGDPDLYWIETF